MRHLNLRQAAAQDMKVVFKKGHFHGGQLIERDPAGQRRVVASSDGGQFAACAQIQRMHVGDGAPPLAAVGVVEYVHAPQRRFQLVFIQADAGFFAQFAQARLP